jgi:hypothetical protein
VHLARRVIRFPRNLANSIRLYGLVPGLRHSLGQVAEVLLGSHHVNAPRLADFAAGSLSVHSSAVDILQRYFSLSSDSPELRLLQSEFVALQSELHDRYSRAALNYPEEFAVEEETSRLLYMIVRLHQPRTILETGVANGHTTFFLLRAISANGMGHLHSVDISTDVGALIQGDDVGAWTLHVLDAGRPRKHFDRIASQVGPVDLFLHDSDHSYPWQRWELETTFRCRSKHWLWACDDADASFAFLDFCSAHEIQPVMLMDTRKFFGLAIPRTGAAPPLAPLPNVDR